MKILNAIETANIIPMLYEKTQTKVNVLMSYHLLRGNAYKLTKEYREMIGLLYCDSGAFSANKGKLKLTISEYRRYIQRYGHLFDAVFNLDDDFNNPGHNFNNQAYLEETLSEKSVRPIPVIHDRDDPFEEFEIYVKQGHDYIAVGSNSRLPDDVYKKIKDNYPDVKIHMFGSLNRKMLMNHRPYSADATTWAVQAGNGRIYYWDPIDQDDYLIYIGEREMKDESIRTFENFHHKAELEAFLSEKFGYDHNDLRTSTDARRIVNLHFFKQLEDFINASKPK
jgi:hypothetical protein